MKTVYSHLARREIPDTRGRSTRAPAPAPAPPAKPVAPRQDPETKQLIGVMRETLDYLKLEPTARAKLEAEPMLAAERAAASERVQAAQREYETERGKREKETRRLREILRELDAQNDALAAEVREREARLLEVTQARAATHDSHHEEPPPAPRAPAPAAPPPPAPVPPRPEDFEFEFTKHVNGLLRSMTIKAPGYAPLVVEIMRGADNRFRHIKVRNP